MPFPSGPKPGRAAPVTATLPERGSKEDDDAGVLVIERDGPTAWALGPGPPRGSVIDCVPSSGRALVLELATGAGRGGAVVWIGVCGLLAGSGARAATVGLVGNEGFGAKLMGAMGLGMCGALDTGGTAARGWPIARTSARIASSSRFSDRS